jgi:hypothetical protein
MAQVMGIDKNTQPPLPLGYLKKITRSFPAVEVPEG